MASTEPWLLENGNIRCLTKEMKHGHGRTAHNMSSSSLRKKSDLTLISKVRRGFLRSFLVNLQEVLLGTKLSILFLAIPFAIAAECKNFGRPWVFALSLLGLTPLAERVSFLTEQIAFYTGPTETGPTLATSSTDPARFYRNNGDTRVGINAGGTFRRETFLFGLRRVGGLLNATCGNATELIISILALVQHKVDIVKYSLLGSILSNLLLVLGSSLLCGGIANLGKEQKFDRKQADVNALLLLLGLLCHVLPLMFRYAENATELTGTDTLALSRASCIVMLIAYISYLVFQLWTHRRLFEASEDEEEDSDVVSDESAVIGFSSAIIWLVLMTVVIALLSEYVVGTIEDASNSWGLSVSFISVILLPIVGNAAEHAGAIIFAFKNKLDITLGVALGSATQIAIFVIPLSVIVAWIIGIDMNLDLNILETSCLALSIIVTAFTLQDGTSHYLKGLVLLLCYLVMGTCFFIFRTSKNHAETVNITSRSSNTGVMRV